MYNWIKVHEMLNYIMTKIRRKKNKLKEDKYLIYYIAKKK